MPLIHSTEKNQNRSWGARWLHRAVVVAFALGASGCAIRYQAPVREVAYDFSDADFYGRSYAPSPNYREPLPVRVVAVGRAQSTAPTVAQTPRRRVPRVVVVERGRPGASRKATRRRSTRARAHRRGR